MELCRTIENETMEKMGYGNGQSLTMEKKTEIGNGKVLKNRKKWDIEMERFRTMGKIEIGMESSPTKENMEIRNGTVPSDGKYGNREWNGPEQ